MTLTIYNFDLQASSEILQLRTTIFNRLFELYENYPKFVFIVLESYVNGYHQAASDEIFSNDAKSLVEFIQVKLTPENLTHCIFANEYFDLLENRQVAFDNKLREKFQGAVFLTYQLLIENRKDFIQYEYAEYERIRKEKFASYFAEFSDLDIEHFIDNCLEIGDSVKQSSRDRDEVVSGFGVGMSVLAETRKDIFDVAIYHYLQRGDVLDLNPILTVRLLMMNYGETKTITLLKELDYPTKNRWLFGYYQMLPPDKIVSDDLSSLYKLFQDTEYSQMPNHLDFLLEYALFDNRVVAKVAQIILDKGDSQNSAWILHTIINPYSEIHKLLSSLFKDDVGTLKRVYLTVKQGKTHDDHNSATLAKILELDPEFIVEYIEWIYSPKEEGSRWHHDTQDYSGLWKHKNYHEIFKRIIELVYKKEKSAHWYTELRQFFMSNEGKRLDADILQRQEELLTELVNTRYRESDFVELLFEVIAYFPAERRSRLIYTFLQHNKNFIDFQRLQLESSSMSWSGSAVPVYQKRIDYLKSLLPMLDSAQLLEHRVYVQQMIDSLENQKNLEKKRDFIGDDF